MGNSVVLKNDCIFCDIVAKSDKSKILFSNDKLVLFADIKPASAHHYLIIPRKHIVNANSLQGHEHISLVEDMYACAKEYLLPIAGEDLEDCLFGFHFPPFVSVNHLHLHAIYPAKSMNFINSYTFLKGSWYFVSPEVLLTKLAKNLN